MKTWREVAVVRDPAYDYIAADAERLTGGNVLLLQDPDGLWQPFAIRQADTAIGEVIIKEVFAEHLYYELGQGQPRSYNLTDSPGALMMAALEGTRWQVGMIASSLQSRVLSLVAVMVSPLKYLRQIQSAFGARLRFRCEIDGHQVSGLYVDLLEEDIEFSGQRFEFDHNLDDVKIMVDYSNTVTALVGTALGKEIDPETGEAIPMTFAEVEWHKANGDPVDKPFGQIWVGDEQARLLYGIPDGHGGMRHRFGIHESQAETLEGLLQGTWTVLKRSSRPQVTVQARVADLEQVKMVDIVTGEMAQLSHEKIRLGNICHILAREKGIVADLEMRVIKITRPLKAPELTQVEFGDPVPLQSRKILELAEWQRWANRRGGIWDRAKAFDNEGNLDVAQTKIVMSAPPPEQGIMGLMAGTMQSTPEKVTLVGSEGVLSVFQYVSTGNGAFNDSGGFSNLGLEPGPIIIAGRTIVFVPIPHHFKILSATLELTAIPVFYDNPYWPDTGEHETKWKQSRNLKLYRGQLEQGHMHWIADSGNAILNFGQGEDVTPNVLGVSSWSPHLAYSGDDPDNTENTVQTISGDISQYLTAGQTAVFFVATTDLPTPENAEHNQGLGKIVVTVTGYKTSAGSQQMDGLFGDGIIFDDPGYEGGEGIC